MDRAARPVAFGEHLRHWRRQRRLTQLALALQSEVSARHLSWLEAGKSLPSRAMVLRLAEQLQVPLRERNAWLVAAGYAPLYAERHLADPALAAARQALEQLLRAQEPNPALAVDGQWNLVAANRMVMPLLQGVAPALLEPPVNVLRLALHPQGLAPSIGNLPAWRAHLLARLERQIDASGSAALRTLAGELRAYPGGTLAAPSEEPDLLAPVALPLELHTPHGRLALISTVAVFGAPHDIVLAELAIESFYPADEASAALLQALAARLT